MRIEKVDDLRALHLNKSDGLIPVVAQHARTGEVLMLAYANSDALERTLASGVMWYYSRSRSRLWKKGEESGNVQSLIALYTDCDRDAVVAHVEPTGPSCHTGEWSCFGAPPTLSALDNRLAERAAAPDGPGYTRRLLADDNLRLKKLGEEAVELAVACQRGDRREVAEEAADLVYHTLVAARAVGVDMSDILAVLRVRSPTDRG